MSINFTCSQNTRHSTASPPENSHVPSFPNDFKCPPGFEGLQFASQLKASTKWKAHRSISPYMLDLIHNGLELFGEEESDHSIASFLSSMCGRVARELTSLCRRFWNEGYHYVFHLVQDKRWKGRVTSDNPALALLLSALPDQCASNFVASTPSYDLFQLTSLLLARHNVNMQMMVRHIGHEWHQQEGQRDLHALADKVEQTIKRLSLRLKPLDLPPSLLRLLVHTMRSLNRDTQLVECLSVLSEQVISLFDLVLASIHYIYWTIHGSHLFCVPYLWFY